MANADAPFGLRPVSMLDGSPYNGQTIRMQFAAADAGAAFIGDLVSGSTDAGTEGVPSVTQGAATGVFVGVVTSFEFDPDDLTLIHRLTLTQRACQVCPALDVIFEIQSSGTGSLTDILNTADVTVGTGSTVTGLSAMELDDSDMGTGVNLQIMGLVNREDNDVASANANWLVRINESQLRGVGTGVA